MGSKTTKKPRKGFKRSQKEWEESISGHIGHILDNSTIKDIFDALIMGGLAYAGFNRLKTIEGALLGPISYKIAQSPSLPAGIAGVSGLIFLGGLMSAGGGIPPEEGGGTGFWEKTTELKCKEGYVLDWNIIQGWHCKPMRPGA